MSEIEEPMQDYLAPEAKSAVKLKQTTRGMAWEIKVVAGEEDLIEGLRKSAVIAHNALKDEFEKVEAADE